MTDATARFAELVGRPDAEIALDEGAFLIAAHAYPDLDVDREQGRLDELAASCPPTLEGVCERLFDVLGFTGNRRRYSDPRNSFLNEVLDRRLGIPISLAVLTMEVGRRVGLTLEGVGMPGHFLVRHLGDPPVLVDAFSGGRILTEDDCAELFRSVHGTTAPFDPSMLAPVGNRAILTRMLANLRQVYLATGNAWAAGWVLRLRTTVPAETPQELADVAAAEAAIGRFADAAARLEELAEHLPEQAADRARGEAKLLRSRLN